MADWIWLWLQNVSVVAVGVFLGAVTSNIVDDWIVARRAHRHAAQNERLNRIAWEPATEKFVEEETAGVE